MKACFQIAECSLSYAKIAFIYQFDGLKLYFLYKNRSSENLVADSLLDRLSI